MRLLSALVAIATGSAALAQTPYAVQWTMERPGAPPYPLYIVLDKVKTQIGTFTPGTGLSISLPFLPTIENSNLAQMPVNTLKCNNTGSPATPVDCTATQAKSLLAIASSDVSGLGYFATGTDATNLTGTVAEARLPASNSPGGKYADVAPGVAINKVMDRLLIGAGVTGTVDYAYPTTTPGQSGTWIVTGLDANLRYLEKAAQFVVGSKAGSTASLAFTRQSDNDQLVTDPVPISYAFLSYNDITPGTRSVWGVYGESHRVLAAGPAIGQEVEVVNKGSESTVITSYGTRFAVGEDRALAYGHVIGCGGEFTTPTRYPCTAAMVITPNAQPFRAGIVFLNNSISADANGLRPAIEMPLSTSIVFKSAGGLNSIAATMRAENTNPATQQRIVFETGAFRVKGVADDFVTETNLFSVGAPVLTAGQTSANSISMIPAGTAGGGSGSTTIAAAGGDTNISISITPKGSGSVVSTGRLVTQASTTSRASLNIPHGAAPSSPSNGDMWTTTSALLAQINGATKTFADLESAQTISGVKTFSSAPKLPSYTVAGLPACNAGTQDTIAVVTDATAPTYNAALTGGGAVRTLVFCNGSAWTSH